MQYILSQNEYDALVKNAENRIGCTTKELQTVCTKIANEMPVYWGWGGNDPKPWGCIYTAKHEWYCDQCPVQKICPSDDKEYSK